ncbi:MAG TPA: acyltransferase [Bacteroidales bacterium]|nr:acyltransferase [Bacteroidales bacterium]
MTFEQPFHPFLDTDFEVYALSLFRFQYENNHVYRTFCDGIHTPIEQIGSLHHIPFMPVSFYKTHDIKTTPFDPETIFHSSGTTGMEYSKHLIKSLSLYEKAFLSSFQHFYGDPSDYIFLALLPNYLENKNSSLIYMMSYLIENSPHAESGFFLYNHQDLYQTLLKTKEKGRKTILFGVTFALLDFLESYSLNYPDLIVFETGGMKGRRKEMVKEEVHTLIKEGFGVPSVHSEYGMCELLSQAYSQGGNLFSTPPWMKMILRDEKEPIPHFSDPDTKTEPQSGAINIIDFANVYSCSFIATEDLGRRNRNGLIEVTGRMDSARLRGCNLMVI